MAWLRVAARLAARGHGAAEPNPCVGCVIVGRDGRLLGEGLHRRCGGPHAEIEALADARRRGNEVRGATMFVTLEPCNGAGRTGPCTEAAIAAGIARVVAAQRDPHAKGLGGLERLRSAGLAVELCPEPRAVAVGAPFVHRATTGLPWVVAKWAQTIDGKVAARSGESRWISSPRSRAMVHRERGRVDAILTGIGTVLADDPLLTARGVRRRRVARRVMVDPRLRVPPSAKLLESVGTAAGGGSPVTIACGAAAMAAAGAATVAALRARGAEVLALPQRREREALPDSPPASASAGAGRLDLAWLLRHLASEHAVATVLVEAGPRLVGSLLEQDLLDEAWIFVAPALLGDRDARSAVEGLAPTSIADARRFAIVDQRRRGPDLMLRLVRRPEAPALHAAFHPPHAPAP